MTTLPVPLKRLEPTTPAIGLALGGGGAKGLAHVAVLEAFDELGLVPARVVGCSMGAIIGAAYCAGMSGREIREYTGGVLKNRTEAMRRLMKARVGKLSDLWTQGLANPILLDAQKVLDAFLPNAIPADFSALRLPFATVAVDYHAHEVVEFSSGAVLPAVAASMAIPGLFRPVVHEHRVLIDGGALNPVPCDHLEGLALRVAVDVLDGSGPRQELTFSVPGSFEATFGSLTLMMQAMIVQRLKAAPPSLLLLPPTDSFRVLDFLKSDEIFAACEPFKSEVKRKLERLIEATPAELIAESAAPRAKGRLRRLLPARAAKATASV